MEPLNKQPYLFISVSISHYIFFYLKILKTNIIKSFKKIQIINIYKIVFIINTNL